MKLIIAGTRNSQIFDKGIVERAMEASPFVPHEIVSGHASGIDHYGEEWARAHDVPIRAFPADWQKHGLKAGPIRNAEMAKYADALLAIPHPNPNRRTGTKDMIRKAKRQGLRVFVYEAAKEAG